MCAEMWGEEEGKGGWGIISPMDTGCYKATQKHKRPHNTPGHQSALLFPSKANLFISDLWHKSHSGTQRGLSPHTSPLKRGAPPERAPWRSACHFQLVPQRQSSARKVGDGSSLRNSFSTPLTLKYGSGGPRLTASLLPTVPRRTGAVQKSIGHISGLTAPAAQPQELLAHPVYFSQSLALR